MFENRGDMKEKRGVKTRNALIEAGLELFGEFGIEGTSTRMLSQRAETNIAAINYHFGGKNELYCVVAEHICHVIKEHMKPAFSQIKMSDIDKIEQGQAEEHCIEILSCLAMFFAEKNEAYSASKIIMREQSKPTEVFAIFYKNVMAPTQKIITTLIAKATGHSPNIQLVKVHTHLFLGQALGLRVARESFLRHLEKAELSSEELSTIYVAVRMQVHAGLAAMRGEI